MKKIYLLLAGLLSMAAATQAQSYTVLKSLMGVSTGKYPEGNLTLVGKHLYGMTSHGGSGGFGCIFTLDTNGNGFRDLHDLNPSVNPNCPLEPYGNLVISGNKMYGMAPAGGSPGSGAIFSCDTDGTNFTVLWGFGSGNDGSNPKQSLTLVGNTLFGVTEQGGTNGYGIIFSISTTGTNYKVLLNFNDTNGYAPICTLTAQGKHLYGTAYYGGAGASFNGCVYRIDTSGANDTVIHTFNSTNGANPYGSVTIVGNKIFGCTELGGSGSMGCIYSMTLNGNDYKVLYNGGGFAGHFTCDLIVVGNTLYGMSEAGAKYGAGSVFSIDTTGSGFTNIISFSGNTGSYLGSSPQGGVIQAGGTYYGMTYLGGVNDSGVVFKLTPGPSAVNNLTEAHSSVVVYPNPSTGMFTLFIKNPSINSESQLEVYNLLGEKIISHTIGAGQAFDVIDMSASPATIYFYKVVSSNGQLLGEGKLIKE